MKKESIANRVIDYHERSKHKAQRYARSPGYLDWDNEPVPFRLYEGCKKVRLPFIEKSNEASYSSLYDRTNNSFQPFTIKNIAALLELSLGLSAWKSFSNNKWALRMNPSSGNLHPTEAYLGLPFSEDAIKGGIYHYNPYIHSLEERAIFPEAFPEKVNKHFKCNGFFIGLSSIYWREAWKYGERAFRYCNHDVGHAIGSISFSANLLGWKLSTLTELSHEGLNTFLGFDRTKWHELEKEHGDLLFFVHKPAGENIAKGLSSAISDEISTLKFRGEPNLLSEHHMDWPVIEEISSLTEKGETKDKGSPLSGETETKSVYPHAQGEAIIRQRRSARDYDKKTRISRDAFFAILERTLAKPGMAPFDAGSGESMSHLLLFVHRVDGLDSGLYFFIRNMADMDELKEKCDKSFSWQVPPCTPAGLPLFLLKKGDYQKESRIISCNQSIASDGVFSLAMISKFKMVIEKSPWLYRQLFWETGMIGQILYLEAEAHSIRATGIGCFLDDLVHDLLNFKDNSYQSLYHFTMGGPVEDERLMTLPPYHHLEGENGVCP